MCLQELGIGNGCPDRSWMTDPSVYYEMKEIEHFNALAHVTRKEGEAFDASNEDHQDDEGNQIGYDGESWEEDTVGIGYYYPLHGWDEPLTDVIGVRLLGRLMSPGTYYDEDGALKQSLYGDVLQDVRAYQLEKKEKFFDWQLGDGQDPRIYGKNNPFITLVKREVVRPWWLLDFGLAVASRWHNLAVRKDFEKTASMKRSDPFIRSISHKEVIELDGIQVPSRLMATESRGPKGDLMKALWVVCYHPLLSEWIHMPPDAVFVAFQVQGHLFNEVLDPRHLKRSSEYEKLLEKKKILPWSEGNEPERPLPPRHTR